MVRPRELIVNLTAVVLERRAAASPAQHRDDDCARVSLEAQAKLVARGGQRIRVYSINAMRAQHSAWFRENLCLYFPSRRALKRAG